MEEKLMMNKEVDIENINHEKFPTLRPRKSKDAYLEKECEVINYNKQNKTLDISFDGYGIRFKNADYFDNTKITVKYKGEIGKPNFEVNI